MTDDARGSAPQQQLDLRALEISKFNEGRLAQALENWQRSEQRLWDEMKDVREAQLNAAREARESVRGVHRRLDQVVEEIRTSISETQAETITRWFKIYGAVVSVLVIIIGALLYGRPWDQPADQISRRLDYDDSRFESHHERLQQLEEQLGDPRRPR